MNYKVQNSIIIDYNIFQNNIIHNTFVLRGSMDICQHKIWSLAGYLRAVWGSRFRVHSTNHRMVHCRVCTDNLNMLLCRRTIGEDGRIQRVICEHANSWWKIGSASNWGRDIDSDIDEFSEFWPIASKLSSSSVRINACETDGIAPECGKWVDCRWVVNYEVASNQTIEHFFVCSFYCGAIPCIVSRIQIGMYCTTLKSIAIAWYTLEVEVYMNICCVLSIPWDFGPTRVDVERHYET